MKELMNKLQLHGRTVWDEEKQALFCNWTCTGFTVRFTGTSLKAKLTVMADQIPAMPGFPPNPDYYPHIGVVADGVTLENRQDILADGWYDLWQGEEGEHTVRFVKVSENSRGKLGVLALECDGQILEMPHPGSPLWRSSVTPSPAASAMNPPTTLPSSSATRKTAGIPTAPELPGNWATNGPRSVFPASAPASRSILCSPCPV